MDTLELNYDLQYELKLEKELLLKAELTLQKARHENLPDYIINYICEEVVHHEFAIIYIQQKLDAFTIKTPQKTTTTQPGRVSNETSLIQPGRNENSDSTGKTKI
jgi:hypothetical protein